MDKAREEAAAREEGEKKRERRKKTRDADSARKRAEEFELTAARSVCAPVFLVLLSSRRRCRFGLYTFGGMGLREGIRRSINSVAFN